jgi:hypothetical protein
MISVCGPHTNTLRLSLCKWHYDEISLCAQNPLNVRSSIVLRIWGTYGINQREREPSFWHPYNFLRLNSTFETWQDSMHNSIRWSNLTVDLEVPTIGPHTFMTRLGEPGCTLCLIKVYYLQQKEKEKSVHNGLPPTSQLTNLPIPATTISNLITTLSRHRRWFWFADLIQHFEIVIVRVRESDPPLLLHCFLRPECHHPSPPPTVWTEIPPRAM